MTDETQSNEEAASTEIEAVETTELAPMMSSAPEHISGQTLTSLRNSQLTRLLTLRKWRH